MTEDPSHPDATAQQEGGATSEIREALTASDLEMVRVLDDLVGVLIDSGIITLTDLPRAAQEKLDRRLRLRSRLAGLHGLVGEADEIPLP